MLGLDLQVRLEDFARHLTVVHHSQEAHDPHDLFAGLLVERVHLKGVVHESAPLHPLPLRNRQAPIGMDD